MIKSPDKGCTLQLIQGWSWDATSSKQSIKQEALVYSPTRTPKTIGGDWDFDSYPFTTVVSQLRFKGSSRVFKLRYESIEGKDFVLEGYNIEGVTRREAEADR